MDSFRTDIKISKPLFRIDHSDTIFSIGSCFAEHMHSNFSHHYFRSYSNPNGIVYNPVSIALQMNHLLIDAEWMKEDLLFDHDLYHGLHHHGDFSGTDELTVLSKMNQEKKNAQLHLQKSTIVLITFGTSIVYTLKKSNRIVANCHKIPASEFSRRFLTINEIIDHTFHWIESLMKINPSIHFIFTISPVRYLKEGFSENTRSKSRLALAIEQLCTMNSAIHYFPAYEIVMDDLRDYRFYKDDLIHPSDTATKYVWQKFRETYFDQETTNLVDALGKIRRAQMHKPIHPDSMAHRKFIAKLEMDIIELQQKYPYLNLS